MADKRISELNELTPGSALTDNDLLAIVNAGETKRVTLDTLDYRWKNNVDHVVVVQKDPRPYEFSTITAALNSITDASATNRYLVYVGPGTYQETVTMKEYVYVLGSERATIIQPPSATSNIIVASDNSSLSDVILQGATGTNAAAIYMVGGAAGSEFNVERVIFRSNYHFAYVDSTGGNPSLVLTQCEPGLTAVSVQPFVLRGTGTGVMRINGFVGPMGNPANAMSDFAFVTGSGNQLISTNFIVNLVSGATATNGFRVNDGGTLVAVSNILSGFGTAFYAENVGASAPTLRLAAIGITDSVTLDLNIAHPGTIGNVGGNFDTEKVTISDSTSDTFKMVALDSVAPGVGITILGDIYQSEIFSKRVNVSKLTRETATLGWVNDGATVLTDAGGLMVTVAAGSGFALDSAEGFVKELTWASDSIAIPDDSDRYVYVNNSGTIVTDASFPDTLENILLGRVVTRSGDIYFIEDSPMDISHQINSLVTLLREALGPIFPQTGGCSVSENGVTARALDITNGFYYLATRKITVTGGTGITWDAYYGGTNVVSGQTQVDNAQYDNAGTLTALTTGYYAKHLVCVVEEGADQRFFLVYAQAEYDSEAGALAAPLPSLPTFFKDAVVSVASVVVQEGAANIVSIADERPHLGYASTGTSAVSSHGALSGLTADDHPQYLLTNGTRAMSANLNMGGNAITNVGTVDGVDVSTHAARHAGGGADAIPVATGSVAGLMSSTDKSKLDGLPSSAVPTTRRVDTGNGLSGGGDLSADRTLSVVAADASVSVSVSGVAVGILQSDASHGVRGGGTQHANAVASGAAGFMTGTDKAKLDGIASGAQVNPTVRQMFLPASRWTPTAAAPAQPGSRALPTNGMSMFYYAFATGESIDMQMVIPQDWNNGTIVFKPYWTSESSTGTVIFSLAGFVASHDDVLTTAFGTAVTSTTTKTASNDLQAGPVSSAMTLAGSPATGDLVCLRLSRSGGTLAADAQLIGIMIEFTVSGSNPTALS